MVNFTIQRALERAKEQNVGYMDALKRIANPRLEDSLELVIPKQWFDLIIGERYGFEPTEGNLTSLSAKAKKQMLDWYELLPKKIAKPLFILKSKDMGLCLSQTTGELTLCTRVWLPEAANNVR